MRMTAIRKLFPVNRYYSASMASRPEVNAVCFTVTHSEKTVRLTADFGIRDDTSWSPRPLWDLKIYVIPMPRYNAKKFESTEADIHQQIENRSGDVWDVVAEWLTKRDITLGDRIK